MHILKDFKNFGYAELDLFEPLTILLGRNGSGKTNLIEGVGLFAALARGVPVNEVTDVGRDGSFEVRGGLESCIRFGARGFQLRLSGANVIFEGDSYPLDYCIEIAAGRGLGCHISAETLYVGDRVFFEAHSTDGEVLDVSYSNFAPGRNPKTRLSTSSSVLSRYDEVVAHSKTNSRRLRYARETVDAVKHYLRSSYTFDPAPRFMRNYERASPQPRLLWNGGNLSAVLFALSKGDKAQRGTLGRITETIRQIPEEPFDGIDFVETSLGDVMAGFRSASGAGVNGSRMIDARLLSDGTLRMLAVLVALETTPPASRIVIEEFDAGLHPTRAELLVRHLADAAKRHELNVVLTTHNPAFMDALSEAQMENVWVCHRDPSRNASKVTRLTDLDLLATMGLSGGLGDYVARGALEKRLAGSFSEDRRKAVRKWIESVA